MTFGPTHKALDELTYFEEQLPILILWHGTKTGKKEETSQRQSSCPHRMIWPTPSR